MYKILLIIMILTFPSISRADVYVVTDPSGAIYSLSEQNDAVIPQGYKLSVVKGNISNLPINGDPTLYNFNNGTFSLDKGKVKAQQKSQQDDISAQTAKANIRNSAIGKLKALGLTDDEIGSLGK